MPVAIPSSDGPHRYHLAAHDGQVIARVSLAEALQAFADDLLQSGDVRLALDRAFRWGYLDEDGEHIAGLQEQLQELRFQRERVLRHIEDDAFLDRIAPELDCLDHLDGTFGDASEGAAEGAAERSNLERLAEHMEEGYRTDQAQKEFEKLVGQLRSAAGLDTDMETAQETGSSSSPDVPKGPATFQPAGSRRAQAARRVAQMLFAGVVPAEERDGTGDQQRAGSGANLAADDLQRLRELARVQAALDRLERIGSVMQLADEDLTDIADAAGSDLATWLQGWQEAIKTATVSLTGRTAPGQIELPPEVVSAIGRDLLKGLFSAASSPVAGEHQSVVRGNAGDPAEETVSWEFGRPLDLNLVATVSNAVMRTGRRIDRRIDLVPDDFAVVERTSRTSVSTVMAIDRSRSMGQSGAWTAAKKVGLAMHELIRQSYPRDSLELITFSSSAEPVDIRDIPELQWDKFEHGTHLQAALELGRVMHRRSPAGTKQIVVITDGEPTLATVSGEDVFASPPSSEILNATMAEVVRCTREGIVINIVMLNGEASPSGFAEQVVRVNRGRIFVATNESLGSYLLRDYVSR